MRRKPFYRPFWDNLLEQAYEIGLSTNAFWRTTPLNFARMVAAYRRKQEMILLPLRRIEAATWNVQIAKTKDGKQIEPSALYPLEFDGQTQVRRRKQKRTPKIKTHFNADEMKALTDFFNQ